MLLALEDRGADAQDDEHCLARGFRHRGGCPGAGGAHIGERLSPVRTARAEFLVIDETLYLLDVGQTPVALPAAVGQPVAAAGEIVAIFERLLPSPQPEGVGLLQPDKL